MMNPMIFGVMDILKVCINSLEIPMAKMKRIENLNSRDLASDAFISADGRGILFKRIRHTWMPLKI